MATRTSCTPRAARGGIGAHVYAGTSIFRPHQSHGHSFGKVDLWPAYNASSGGAGLFADLTGEADTESVALVIAVAPNVSIDDLISRQQHYKDWSKTLNKPIYVISSDDEVFQFLNGEVTFWPPTVPTGD